MKGKRWLAPVSLVMAAVMLLCSCTSEKETGCKHSYGEWEIVFAATCTAGGRKLHKCTKCGQSETAFIDVVAHTLSTVAGKEPTCTETGYTESVVCSECGTIVTASEELAALGHDKKSVIVQPTLSTTGLYMIDCKRCGYSGKETAPVLSPESVGLPVLKIEGEISSATKYREVLTTVEYCENNLNFTAYASLKVQGSSSSSYEKKNYTIKFFEDSLYQDKYKVDLGWGKENKYCLKANYIDFSQARNIVSASLYGDVARTRSTLDKNLASLVNCGAIDGYPILVYVNGYFHGLYTMNIPKDKWLFGMKNDETKKQAILMGDDWSSYTNLSAEINGNFNGWDLEHCSTEDTSWVRASFNNMIRFINNNDGEDFINGIGKYVDVDATIDVMLFSFIINATDNVAKNTMYVTYDGVKWIPSVYDLDSTWGLYWDGTDFVEDGRVLPTLKSDGTLKFFGSTNILWQKIMINFKDKVKARYNELRNGVLSNEKILNKFKRFTSSIPDIAYESEKKRWPSVPTNNLNYMSQIEGFLSRHIPILDRLINNY